MPGELRVVQGVWRNTGMASVGDTEHWECCTRCAGSTNASRGSDTASIEEEKHRLWRQVNGRRLCTSADANMGRPSNWLTEMVVAGSRWIAHKRERIHHSLRALEV